MRREAMLMAKMALVLCALTGGLPTASAHTMYVNVTSHVPNPERGTKLYFGWGETLPVADMLGAEWLKGGQVVEPDGTVRPLEKPSEFLTRVEFSQKGTHLITAELNPGFYTIYSEDGKKKHHMGPKTGLENVEMSLHFQQQGKAIVNVGGLDETFRKPVGHTLEIIPLKNPALLREGDTLPIEVLFEGKPVPGYPKLMATYMGFSTTGAFAYATSVVHGRSEVKILRSGVWYINVNYRARPTGEMAEKCDELSYTATLTFEVGRSPEDTE
jgi:uncharacterized GH25 family protein